MKNKVIAWIKSGCNFNEGLVLLPSGGYLDNFLRICKIQGDTKSNKEMLHYQLIKAAGISEREAAKIKTSPQEPKPKAPKTPEQDSAMVPDHPDPQIAISETQKVKLRDEFPFLSDPDCPEELKILVSDKITSYHNYLNAHERLFTCQTPEEIKVACRDTVENYLENRKIYDELEHYKLKGKMLKKHPIFKRISRAKEISAMKLADLVKHNERLKMNIWRTKKAIEEEPGSDKTAQRVDRLKEYEFELTVVNRLLESK